MGWPYYFGQGVGGGRPILPYVTHFTPCYPKSWLNDGWAPRQRYAPVDLIPRRMSPRALFRMSLQAEKGLREFEAKLAQEDAVQFCHLFRVWRKIPRADTMTAWRERRDGEWSMVVVAVERRALAHFNLNVPISIICTFFIRVTTSSEWCETSDPVLRGSWSWNIFFFKYLAPYDNSSLRLHVFFSISNEFISTPSLKFGKF